MHAKQAQLAIERHPFLAVSYCGEYLARLGVRLDECLRTGERAKVIEHSFTPNVFTEIIVCTRFSLISSQRYGNATSSYFTSSVLRCVSVCPFLSRRCPARTARGGWRRGGAFLRLARGGQGSDLAASTLEKRLVFCVCFFVVLFL